MVLHQEEPVVSKQVVARERVRLSVQTVTEQELLPISADILARYASDAAREVEGVSRLVEVRPLRTRKRSCFRSL